MSKIIESLKKYSEEHKYTLTKKDSSTIMAIHFTGVNGHINTIVVADTNDKWLQVSSNVSLSLSKNQIVELYALTNRINLITYRLKLMINTDETAVISESSIPFSRFDGDFGSFIESNASTFDFYLPVYYAVAYGGKSVEEAMDGLVELYYEEEIEESKNELPN